MKVSTDALIAALLDQRFHLTGEKDGGVSLHCRDCSSLVGFYSRKGAVHADPEAANVTTVAGLWAQAVDHLAGAHRARSESSTDADTSPGTEHDE